jgi:hypothetical protein
MGVKAENYLLPVKRGDVTTFAIEGAIAFSAIADALAQLAAKSDIDLSPHIEAIRKTEKAFEARFDDLTGWTPDDD